MAGRTLQEISTFMDTSFKDYKDYTVIHPLAFQSLMLMLAKTKSLVGFDTETDGVNICNLKWGSKNKHHLVGICLSWEDDQGIYIPVRHTQFENIPMKWIVETLFPLLETLPLATHNGIFDYKVMYDLGCRINIVHDSMLLIFNICSKVAKGSKALKNITRLLYNVTTIEFSDIFPSSKDYGKFADIEKEVCRIYACADSDYTRRIVLDHLKFLSSEQLQTYMRDCHYIPLIAEAEYQGKPINMEAMARDREKCIQNINYLEDIIFNYVGWKLTGDFTARYTFKESSQPELLDVLYNKLKYDKVDIKGKTGYKIDKFVLKRMRDAQLPDGAEDDYIKKVIGKTIPNPLDPEKPLIDYKKVVKSKHVLAHLLLTYRKQQKELSSFFNKITNEANDEIGVYYSSISMTNTETSRLVDFMQTLDGGLKYLVCVPTHLQKYMFVFDFAQIEYRVMVALACMHAITKQLDNPHTDFHVVIASLILNCRPEDIDDETRKKFKSINFGIPYGMAVQGLINSIYGVGLSEKEYKEAEIEVAQRLEAWCNALPEIILMLDCYRDIATTPRPYDHPTVKGFKNTSYVQSPDGRARVFDLGDGSKQTTSKIRRMAGNFPIQCFAAYLFKEAVNSFREALIANELMNVKVRNPDSPSGYSFESKVTINGFIHDEAIGFADNDVNPAYLMKLIQDFCMLKLTGHPTYYCGINIVRNWGEGKEGAYEAPIDFVSEYASYDQKIVEPRSDWPEVVAEEVVNFCNKASAKYVESIAGEQLTKDHILDYTKVLSNWKDYYHKKKIKSYGKPYRAKDDIVIKDSKGKATAEDKIFNNLGGILYEYGYKDLIIKYPGRTDTVRGLEGEIDPVTKEKELTHIAYSSEDYDETDDFDVNTDMFMNSLNASAVSLLDPESLNRNVSLLSKFLTNEF